MPIEVTNHKKVIPAVLSCWDRISAEEIGELAAAVWRNTDDMTGECDMLASLQICKGIGAISSCEEAKRLWDGVEGGFPDAQYGGLCHGEDSPNYAKVVRLVESVFAAAVAPLVEVEFDRLAITASQIVDSQARAEAYQDAQWELLSMFGDFGITEAGARKFERLAEAKGKLLDQLIDEANGVPPTTTKRRSRKRIK
jgi:hypothetical protein